MRKRMEEQQRGCGNVRKSFCASSALYQLRLPLAAIVAWMALAALPVLYVRPAEATPASNAHLSYFGGNIVVSPTYVNIFWGAFWTSGTGLSSRQQLNGFVQTVGPSSEFVSVLKQYTGPSGEIPQAGIYTGEVLIPGEPGGTFKVITDAQIRTAIDGWIAEGRVSANSLDVVYNVYFPTGVTVQKDGSDASGSQFCSYHSSFQTTRGTGGLVRYIVMPYPDSAGCLFEPTAFDSLTVQMSHQMAEVVTDPDVGVAIDTGLNSYLGWYDNNNGEIGDICASEPDATLFGYKVQTLWSNLDGRCIATEGPSDTTPPVITPIVVGTLGGNGWYTTNIGVNWSVTDAESPISSTTGCDSLTITSDTGGQTLTCTATSAGGTSTQSITLKRDATKPTVTYVGNLGSYAVDQIVAINCMASDNLSGVASSTCASINGPAYSFSLGTNTFSASVIDNAGNSAAASTSFTVTASSLSLLQLTHQFVVSSAKYQALPPQQQSAVDQRVDALARILALVPGAEPKQKAALIDAFERQVTRLVQEGWLTPTQASSLDKIANAL